MTEWVRRWKPCWVLIDDTFKKAYFEDWQLLKDEQNYNPVEDSAQTVPCASDSSKLRKTEHRDCALKCEQPLDTSSAPKSSWPAVGEPDAPTWKLSGTQGTSAFWEKQEAPLPLQERVCNYTHPMQHSPFPERLKLPYPDEEILSGYEEDVSFIRDGYTTWEKADFNTILERHAVDTRKTLTEFRQASARRHDKSSQEYHIDSNVRYRSSVQKRLSIYNWRTSTWKRRRH